MRNHNELEVHIFDPGDMLIPGREDSWGVPIYVRPRHYIRNRQKWKHDHDADEFFRAGGEYLNGDLKQRLSIEVTYDIETARMATAEPS